MNCSSPALKRARPALGTILLFQLRRPADLAESAVDSVLSGAFDLCGELENRFSKFREASDVSRLNHAPLEREVPVSRDFAFLLALAEEIRSASGEAFNPFGAYRGERAPVTVRKEGSSFFAMRAQEVQVDLSGIAKGYIVDRLHDFLNEKLPGVSGAINAGGDLRFLNESERRADVRVANGAKFQPLLVAREAIATSSFQESLHNPDSTTRYDREPARGLGREFTVSATAPSCALADAFTKVGWFANEPDLRAACAKFDVQVLIFDGNGAMARSIAEL